MIMGGHAAEVLIFGEMSTGPSNDIQQATETSRRMVTQYGMSPKLGPRAFGRREELVFLGRDIAEQRNYSERVAEEIDDEVSHLIDDAHRRAMDTLLRHQDLLDKLAERLIEVETLDAEEFTLLVDQHQGRAPATLPDVPETLAESEPLEGEVAEEPDLKVPSRPKPRPAEGTV